MLTRCSSRRRTSAGATAAHSRMPWLSCASCSPRALLAVALLPSPPAQGPGAPPAPWAAAAAAAAAAGVGAAEAERGLATALPSAAMALISGLGKSCALAVLLLTLLVLVEVLVLVLLVAEVGSGAAAPCSAARSNWPRLKWRPSGALGRTCACTHTHTYIGWLYKRRICGLVHLCVTC